MWAYIMGLNSIEEDDLVKDITISLDNRLLEARRQYDKNTTPL